MNMSVQTRPSLQGLLENNNCVDASELPSDVLANEIEDVKTSIDNEKLSEMDADTLDESDMHRENIANMQGYLKLLLDLKDEREKPAMNENKYNPEGKFIRFIDSRYNELFRVPDGGYITITRDNGEQLVRKCAFVGECHTTVGHSTYHICEFAEMMERTGNTYAPCMKPEKVSGYMITDRTPVGNKEFIFAHNPKAADPYATWVTAKGEKSYEIGHYWSKKETAWSDYLCRIDAERTGRHYDHTQQYRQNRDSGAR
jgi:hypothetical protein